MSGTVALHLTPDEISTIVQALTRDADRFRELRNPVWNREIYALESLAGRIQKGIWRA